ncbi:TonB-dependent receptor plug domain-containing protein [Chryseobacterium gwangjuense]|uniref:TonB-dependent receptor plug domain-containing protein n=1 Tax=Chryseobacterium gwangjuense TaxID=1069980 RepID=UPI001E3BB818|nr:TonB-dependent receptor plug domain-containing protein [Chryseobacterium gwangjuense]MCE3074759.1 TonB-dependent receptor plug domain-containing protein [Chryseobacterium gwangjuense]
MKITIPTPCHENWEAMTSEEKGRFCSVCSKTVRDFTRSSDEELYQEMKSDPDICGNFNENQLNRNIALSVFGKIALGLVVSLGASITVNGQKLKTDEDLKKIDFKQGFVGFRKVNDTIGASNWVGRPSKKDIESTQPRIFLDGFRISEDKMKKLNRENIESIDILDGTAATAIYGKEGQYGAVVITSKKILKNRKSKIENK